MTQTISIDTSQNKLEFEKWLAQINHSGDHLIINQDGLPVAVVMSFQEYEKLHADPPVSPSQELPPVMTLEEAFGSVEPISQPEDFNYLRETALDEHLDHTASASDKA